MIGSKPEQASTELPGNPFCAGWANFLDASPWAPKHHRAPRTGDWPWVTRDSVAPLQAENGTGPFILDLVVLLGYDTFCNEAELEGVERSNAV